MHKKNVRIGLIGAGFMGRCHANAFRSVGGLFDLDVNPVMEMLADVGEDQARINAAKLGFRRATGDWRNLCANPDIDIVAVTAPNIFHEPMVMAALETRKTIYCEKPLSTTSQSARRMTQAAEANDALTMVGFNFQRNPMVHLAREIIAAGEIGEIVAFRGRHAENYMCNPDAPHSFRTDPEGGGAVADIGSHIVAMARFLIGPINMVSAQAQTVYPTRPSSPGATERTAVVVDDITHALVRFENGVIGNIEANWAATGRNMDLSWEVTGSKGALAFSQERMNELHVYGQNQTPGRDGFSKIETGPHHPPYGNFCPAAGHHLGFNDLKVIEVAELLDAYSRGTKCGPDFREALEVQLTIEAIQNSSKSHEWMTL